MKNEKEDVVKNNAPTLPLKKEFADKHPILMFFISMFIILAIIIAWVDIDDNNSSTEYKKPPVVIGINNVAKTNNFEITVTSVKTLKKVGVEYYNKKPSEGGIFVAVICKYKNMLQVPIEAWDQPNIKLVDSNGTEYSSDVDASSHYAMQIDPDNKIISDLNPGITVKDSLVFEISKKSYSKGSWWLLINADEQYFVKIK